MASRKPGKTYRAEFKTRPEEPVPLEEAVRVLKGFRPRKFDQTVEVCMHLGVDPKQPDQALRGSLALPHGIGANRRVIAFCGPDQVAAAKEAGALEAGSEDLVAKIEGGWTGFDVAVASPDQMRAIAKLGRLLGPKGLMPSPKAGTVTPDVPKAVREFGDSKVEFRTDAGGNVAAVIGKLSFAPEVLVDNARALIGHLVKARPASAKGRYLKKVSLSATMTPSVLIAESA